MLVRIFKTRERVYARVSSEGGPLDHQVKEFFSKQACDEWLKRNLDHIKVISLTVITPSTNSNDGPVDTEHVDKYILIYEEKA